MTLLMMGRKNLARFEVVFCDYQHFQMSFIIMVCMSSFKYKNMQNAYHTMKVS